MSPPARFRPATVDVDLGAIRANAALVARLVAPARLCAVVKADGYGHGAAPVAAAALEGGATLLAVALTEEGIALRAAGIGAEILVLSEPPDEAMEAVVAHRLTPTLYRPAAVRTASAVAAAAGRRLGVEVKLDTGMHRLGADPAALAGLVGAVGDAPRLALRGLWTHLAVADEPDDPFTAVQLDRLLRARASLRAGGIEPGRVHAANSAGAIAHPATRLDLVRCGIALYGLLPGPKLAGLVETALGASLLPALTLRAAVHLVRPLAAGERPGYGRGYALGRDGRVGVIQLGYHDGVPRRLATTGGAVLIGGRRRPIAGAISMDQLIVDLGDDDAVRPGDEAVLIGRQGDEEISAAEWAERLGTIAYEVVARLGERVPRRYLGAGPGDDRR